LIGGAYAMVITRAWLEIRKISIHSSIPANLGLAKLGRLIYKKGKLWLSYHL
jgi:hypothetical protein